MLDRRPSLAARQGHRGVACAALSPRSAAAIRQRRSRDGNALGRRDRTQAHGMDGRIPRSNDGQMIMVPGGSLMEAQYLLGCRGAGDGERVTGIEPALSAWEAD